MTICIRKYFEKKQIRTKSILTTFDRRSVVGVEDKPKHSPVQSMKRLKVVRWKQLHTWENLFEKLVFKIKRTEVAEAHLKQSICKI